MNRKREREETKKIKRAFCFFPPKMAEIISGFMPIIKSCISRTRLGTFRRTVFVSSHSRRRQTVDLNDAHRYATVHNGANAADTKRLLMLMTPAASGSIRQ